MKHKRIPYLDAIKVLSIYLVCTYHYGTLDQNILGDGGIKVYLSYVICSAQSIAVPLFFMVNGALLLSRNYDVKMHFMKTGKMCFLTIIWSFITLAGLLLIFNDNYSFKRFLAILFFLDFGRNFHLWFLHALISIYLLFPVVKEIFDSSKKYLLYLLGTVIFVFSFGNSFLNMVVNLSEFLIGVNYLEGDGFDFFPLVNPFSQYTYSFFYFILGGFLVRYSKRIGIKQSTIILLIFFLFNLAILAGYGMLISFSDQEIYDTVWNGYSSIMTLMMAISVFLMISRIDYKNRKVMGSLKLIGENTLGIYLIHVFVGSIATPYFEKSLFSDSLIFNLFYGVFIVLASLLIVLGIRKIPGLRQLVLL